MVSSVLHADLIVASGATFGGGLASLTLTTPSGQYLPLFNVVAAASPRIFSATDTVVCDLVTGHTAVVPAAPSVALAGVEGTVVAAMQLRNIVSPVSYASRGSDVYLWDATARVLRRSAGAGGFTAAELDAPGAVIYVVTGASQPDYDNDGISDVDDNCRYHANADQYDANNDGFGNRCDADLTNDGGLVNTADYAIFRSRYLSTDAEADFNHNGIVNTADYAIFRQLYLQPPGPSARFYFHEH